MLGARWLWAATVLSTGTMGIPVYDCTHPNSTISMISLETVKECEEPQIHTSPRQEREVQVLHSDGTVPVEAYQCIKTESRMVQKCLELHATTYGGKWVMWEETIPLTRKQCLEAAQQGTHRTGSKVMNVTLGATSSYTYFTRGNVGNNGECEVETFQAADGQLYYGHYEQTMIQLTVTKVTATLEELSNSLTFGNGLIGRYDKGVLQDDIEGTLAWITHTFDCEGQVSQLYHGAADLYKNTRNQADPFHHSFLVIKNRDTKQYAGLGLRSATRICGRRCHATTAENVVVCLRPLGNNSTYNDFPRRVAGDTAHYSRQEESEDWMIRGAKFRPDVAPGNAPWETKLGYLHFTTNVRTEREFARVLRKICEVERKAISNQLQAVAHGNPYALGNLLGRGHMAMVAGTTAYITQCVKREAVLSPFPNCTAEIPVTVYAENVTKFADPFTRILRDVATVVPCSEITPSRFKMGGSFWCATPGIRLCEAPRVLAPDQRYNDEERAYVDYTLGLDGSLYSTEQLAQHRAYQKAVTHRSAVIQGLTNAATGGHRLTDRPGFPALPLDQIDLAEVADNVGLVFFPYLSFLRGHFHNVIMILCMFGVIKELLLWLLRVCATYHDRGMGWWILASFSATLFALAMRPWRFVRNMVEFALDPRQLRQIEDDNGQDPEAARRRRERAEQTFREVEAYLKRHPNRLRNYLRRRRGKGDDPLENRALTEEAQSWRARSPQGDSGSFRSPNGRPAAGSSDYKWVRKATRLASVEDGQVDSESSTLRPGTRPLLHELEEYEEVRVNRKGRAPEPPMARPRRLPGDSDSPPPPMGAAGEQRP